jgi:hypothetical protein
MTDATAPAGGAQWGFGQWKPCISDFPFDFENAISARFHMFPETLICLLIGATGIVEKGRRVAR